MLTDILHAFAQNPTNPAYDTDVARARAPRPGTATSNSPKAFTPSATQSEGYCFDNEGPAHRVLVGPVQHRARPRHECRVARVHARRRLRHAGAVALRTAGRPCRTTGLAGAGSLAGARWRVVSQLTLGGLRAGRSRRAGDAHQLLRGRRACALGRQASADRAGVGGRGALRPARRCLRHRVAVDPLELSRPIRALSPATARSASTTANS